MVTDLPEQLRLLSASSKSYGTILEHVHLITKVYFKETFSFNLRNTKHLLCHALSNNFGLDFFFYVNTNYNKRKYWVLTPINVYDSNTAWATNKIRLNTNKITRITHILIVIISVVCFQHLLILPVIHTNFNSYHPCPSTTWHPKS